MTILDEINPSVNVRVRPEPLPPEYRIAWTGAVLLYGLVECSRGGKSSIARLHLLFWGLGSDDAARALAEAVREERGRLALTFPHYPVVDRALEFYRADGAVSVDAGQVTVTEKGRQLVRAALQSRTLEQVRRAGAVLGKAVTESFVHKLSGGR